MDTKIRCVCIYPVLKVNVTIRDREGSSGRSACDSCKIQGIGMMGWNVAVFFLFRERLYRKIDALWCWMLALARMELFLRLNLV